MNHLPAFALMLLLLSPQVTTCNHNNPGSPGRECPDSPASVKPWKLTRLEVRRVEPADDLKIRPRGEWDPAPPRSLKGVSRYRDLEDTLQWIVIHHSAFAEPEGPRQIKRFHLEEYRYADIGYHFVIDRSGDIWEGRDIRYMGGHAGVTREAVDRARAVRRDPAAGTIEDARKLDPDWGAIGIVVDGFFYTMTPTVEQVESLDWLVRRLRRQYAIRSDHVISHREVRERIIKTQGLTPSSKTPNCPGPNLQPVVEALRAGAEDIQATKPPPLADTIRAHATDLAYWHYDLVRRGQGSLDAPIEIRFALGPAGRVLASRLTSERPLDDWFKNGFQQAFNRIEFPQNAAPRLEWYECRLRFDRPVYETLRPLNVPMPVTSVRKSGQYPRPPG